MSVKTSQPGTTTNMAFWVSRESFESYNDKVFISDRSILRYSRDPKFGHQRSKLVFNESDLLKPLTLTSAGVYPEDLLFVQSFSGKVDLRVRGWELKAKIFFSNISLCFFFCFRGYILTVTEAEQNSQQALLCWVRLSNPLLRLDSSRIVTFTMSRLRLILTVSRSNTLVRMWKLFWRWFQTVGTFSHSAVEICLWSNVFSMHSVRFTVHADSCFWNMIL